MENWDEPDDGTLRNRKYLEKNQEKKPRRRRPEPLITKEEVEERIKSIPPPPELTDEEKKSNKAAKRIEKLEKQVRSCNAKLANRCFGLGAKFYTDRNKLVTCRYGKEISIYLSIRYAAVQRAKDVNKGERACYPYLYETNALLLKKLFGISREAALKTIKFLTDSGAWRLVKIEPGKVYIYQLGEKKKVKYQTDGKWEYHYINTFYFNLYKNTKSLNFYKQERERLSKGYRKKEKRGEQQKEQLEIRKRNIERIHVQINKALASLYGKNKAGANAKWNRLAILHGFYNGNEMESLSDMLGDLQIEISDRNREKYGRFKRQNPKKQ